MSINLFASEMQLHRRCKISLTSREQPRRGAKRGVRAPHPSTTTSERLNSGLIVEIETYNVFTPET